MACAGLSVEASEGVIVLGVWVRHSLTGGTNFVDQGLIIIIYPYFEGVTIYRPEDIDISCHRKTITAGYQERTENAFWRIPIKILTQRGRLSQHAIEQKVAESGTPSLVKISQGSKRACLGGNGDSTQCV